MFSQGEEKVKKVEEEKEDERRERILLENYEAEQEELPRPEPYVTTVGATQGPEQGFGDEIVCSAGRSRGRASGRWRRGCCSARWRKWLARLHPALARENLTLHLQSPALRAFRTTHPDPSQTHPFH